MAEVICPLHAVRLKIVTLSRSLCVTVKMVAMYAAIALPSDQKETHCPLLTSLVPNFCRTVCHFKTYIFHSFLQQVGYKWCTKLKTDSIFRGQNTSKFSTVIWVQGKPTFSRTTWTIGLFILWALTKF